MSGSRWATRRDWLRLDEFETTPPPDHSHQISENVSAILKRLGLDQDLWQQRLFEDWASITGEQVAAHSRPGKLFGKTLVIYVAHPIWLQELLQGHSARILEKVQSVAGKKRITRLKFQLDPEGA